MSKFEKLLEEARQWNESGESDSSLSYAIRNGYDTHAVSVWQNSGASVLGFTVEIYRPKELEEIMTISKRASIYHCKACGHYGYYDSDDEVPNTCTSCLSPVSIHKPLWRYRNEK